MHRFKNVRLLLSVIMVFVAVLVSRTAFSEEDVLAAENKQAATPEEIKAEEDKNTSFLLGHILKKAKSLEDTYTDFAPFGAGLFPNGVVRYVWLVKPGETVKDPVEAITIVRQALASQAEGGVLLASAVAYKYGSKEQPQINVELEYATGYSAIVGTKFTKDNDNKMVYGAAAKQDFKSYVFAKVSEAQKKEAK